MLEPVAPLPPTDWIRLSLVYAHLLGCVAALALVARADWSLATASFTVDGLRRAARATTLALGVLWITGLALVYRDTGFSVDALTDSPKLILKLLAVTVLTLNGVLLHALSFPLLADGRHLDAPRSAGLALAGATSTGHWLLAAFVGVSRPLGQWPLPALLTGYVLFCLATLGVAALCAPWLGRRLNGRRRHGAVQTGRRPAGRFGPANARTVPQ